MSLRRLPDRAFDFNIDAIAPAKITCKKGTAEVRETSAVSGVFLLLEVIGHADDYDTFLEEEGAFKH